MKTAWEVVDAIDRYIDQKESEAAGPCIDALIDWGDRDAYREALRRAYGLRAVKALRATLVDQIGDLTEAQTVLETLVNQLKHDLAAPAAKPRRRNRK